MSAIGLWWWTAVAIALLMIPTLVALIIDRRTIDGDRVWAKPLKFELSLAVHFATLALLASFLPASVAYGGPLRDAAVVATIATAFEIFYIGIQAARGRRSHFNVETTLSAMLYGLMAFGASIITAAAALVGTLLLVCDTPSIGAGLKIGSSAGLIGGTVLTLITAFRMGGTMSRFVRPERSGAARMPVTGWSLTVPDRRIPHFFATHMMQLMPVAGLVVDALFLPVAVSVFLVLLCAGGYAFVTLRIFQRVNRGDVVKWPVRVWSVPN